MPHVVDFVTVSTEGLESSPVADALAGLRANEARYFKNKYDVVFTTEKATSAKGKQLVAYVAKVLKDDRDIVFASTPLEATEMLIDGVRWTYVFYESGLSVNVLYTLEDAGKRAVGFKLLRRHGGARGARDEVQVRAPEVQARRHDPRQLLRHQGRVLTTAAVVDSEGVQRDSTTSAASRSAEAVIRPVVSVP